MARFSTDGLDSIIDDLKAIGELSGEMADEMLLAGAEEVKQAWRRAAKMHGHFDTGDMFNSINYSSKPKLVSDIKMIDIYPQGTDRKKVRNAEKAFILHYGTSKRPGSHWIDTADDLSAEPVEKAMREIYEQKMKERNL